MKILHLEIENFRCHTTRRFTFDHNRILLTGPNGAGKTSVLEAINLLAVSKSFLPATDHDLVAHGFDGYTVFGGIIHDLGTELQITVEYAQASGKRIITSATGQCTAQELIGLVPCVVLASVHRDLFAGEPSERRAFVDRILAQCSATYKHALWRHRTALRQRNRLLAQMANDAELDAWTDELIRVTAEVLWKRRQFIKNFNALLAKTVQDLGLTGKLPTIEYRLPWLGEDYQPMQWTDSFNQFQQQLQRRIATLLPLDRERFSTQWGPQRDVFVFVTDGHPIATSASQGQQKLALYALKLTEATYLHQMIERAPILLLDDVFSDLDRSNIRLLEQSILAQSNQWQIFLTAPSSEYLSSPESFAIMPLGN